jgi:hypothetical protein
MAHSLMLAGAFELLSGGVTNINQAPGGMYRLGTGYDLGAPAPTVDYVVSLIGDGSKNVGERYENRVINLPVVIFAPDLTTLATAREKLLQAVALHEFPLVWTREGAKPLVFDCQRATSATPLYSLATEKALVSQVNLTIPALPFGRSDFPVTVPLGIPQAGNSPPPADVVLDNFTSVASPQFVTTTISVTGPNAALWDPAIAPASNPEGKGIFPLYTKTGLNLDITGLTSLTVNAGFGSTNYFPAWAVRGGPVTFRMTLTDNASHTLFFSVTKSIKASNSINTPIWFKIKAPIPLGQTFNYTNVTGYTIAASSIPNTVLVNPPDLRWTQLILDDVRAVAVSKLTMQSGRAVMYDLSGVVGTARTSASWQFSQLGTASAPIVRKITLTGSQPWTAPITISPATVKAECTGAGARGSQATGASTIYCSGGSSGEYAAEPAVAVTPGSTYTAFVAPPVTGTGVQPSTTFTGNSVTVTAHSARAMASNSTTPGAIGTGSANTTHHDGALGGTGQASAGPSRGAGGASSGGSALAGNPGGTALSGGAAGAAVTGGGKGGSGSTSSQKGNDGAQPGAGGGGGQIPSGVGILDHAIPGQGGAGQIILTYTVTPAFSSLIVHRPGPQQPDWLCPYITVPAGDAPDGTHEYPVASLNPSVNARFNGTYTILVATALPWGVASTARTYTVTVNQYEQPGGAVSSVNKARTFTPASPGRDFLLVNGYVIIGNLTLPNLELPHDNLNAIYTVTINSTVTADVINEIIFIDTMGDTCIISTVNDYGKFLLDEPTGVRDIGGVYGTIADRGDAISVLSRAILSGAPIGVDPSADANQSLLVHAQEGIPGGDFTYFPRWRSERLDVVN